MPSAPLRYPSSPRGLLIADTIMRSSTATFTRVASMRRGALIALVITCGFFSNHRPLAAATESVVSAALAAEASLQTQRALELFLTAEKTQPNDPFILRKIARQYSDLEVELKTTAEKKASIERALDYAQRATAVEPHHAENVLSVAICYGKLAFFANPSRKVEYSRLVRDHTLRALALDPDYAWAHHLLGRWHYEVSTLGATTRVFVKLFYGGLPAASTAEAVDHLRRAVDLEPTQLQHHLELGFALTAHGLPAQARIAFTAGLALPSREKHDETAMARARAALAKITADPRP